MPEIRRDEIFESLCLLWHVKADELAYRFDLECPCRLEEAFKISDMTRNAWPIKMLVSAPAIKAAKLERLSITEAVPLDQTLRDFFERPLNINDLDILRPDEVVPEWKRQADPRIFPADEFSLPFFTAQEFDHRFSQSLIRDRMRRRMPAAAVPDQKLIVEIQESLLFIMAFWIVFRMHQKVRANMKAAALQDSGDE